MRKLERYEYIPAQMLLIDDVFIKYTCGCTITTATTPPQPIEKSVGMSLLTQDVPGRA